MTKEKKFLKFDLNLSMLARLNTPGKKNLAFSVFFRGAHVCDYGNTIRDRKFKN